MELDSTVSSIGLYAYGRSCPEGEFYDKFYSLLIGEIQSLGLQSTYIGADGPGYPDKYFKSGGHIHKRLMESEFSNLTSLSILVNPAGSDSPSYDNYFAAHVCYADWMKELLLYVVVNAAFIQFRSPDFEDLLRRCISLYSWDFGFAFDDKAENEPDKYILGVDNGHLSPKEESALIAWYDASPEERLNHLRDLYPYNILSNRQIEIGASNEGSLKNIIEQKTDTYLIGMPGQSTYIWQIPEKSIEKIRSLLRSESILISD